MKGFLALTSVLSVPFCFIEGFLWYASFEGALYAEDGGPIYVAKDEDAFQILQHIPQHDRAKLDEAESISGPDFGRISSKPRRYSASRTIP
jgi:hypothetical protein